MDRFVKGVMDDLKARGTTERGEKTGAAIELALSRKWIIPLENGRYAVTAQGDYEMSWAGLSCACGGGWLVGHRAGCPEAMEDGKADPSDLGD